MSLLQSGLQTSAQPARAVTQGDLYVSGLIVWSLLGLFVLIGSLFLVRMLLRRYARAKQATFNRVTLLVTLPKFRREEESERGGTKEQIKEEIAAAEIFFSAVGGLRAQHGFHAWLFGRSDEIAFEIVSHNKRIRFYVSVPVAMRQMVEQQLSAAYPDVYLEEVEDYNIFQPTGVMVGSHLVFRRQSAFPIKTYTTLEKDPLNAITNILSKLPEEDGAAFQFLVRSSYARWRKPGIKIASDMQQGMKLDEAIKGKKAKKIDFLELAGFGGDKPKEPEKEYRLSPLEDQIVKGLQEKASKAGMDVCIRLVSASKTAEAAQSLMQNMLNAFAQFNIYEYGNSFVKVIPRRKKRIIQDFIYRTFDERNTVVVNAEEMASLWHLPLPWTDTPNIQWLIARKGPAPANVPGPEDGDIELGYNMFRGIKTPVWMKALDRTRHMYIIGKSGSGKSQLIASLALQDIRAGHGVAVVEPHGDLIEQILANIPKERVDDVIVFNPSDVDRPMGLNMLEAKDESMKDFAAQEMVAIFYKLFPPEMIGPMFEHHMRNVMLTLMADTENPGTIAEIPRMFSDVDFQQKWRAKVTDPVIQSYWVNEVDKTSDFHKSEMLGYLISKVGRFVENEMMRNIIGQTRSSFDFRDVMDKKKILLVNLSKGKTGDVNAELLGLIIVSKLQMAALTRADIPEDQRHDFYLYIDEFQNFITDSIATILSEARKYRLNLIIAHQYIGQLVKNNDTKIRDAVFGNVGTNFVARIGPEDVETLEKLYAPEFSGYDMINSDKFTWYVKMIVDNAQIKPFTLNFKPPPKGDVELATAIKELSRLKYGRDRAIVTADLAERMQMVNLGPVTTKPGEF
ncbi:type IV secretory system conjugative DNA transfer family protein [Candidatus Uhrbacteria bacterium]|nr:type IV secretory system conjugative DNA transfer family protein [Candidatus Uhrbacteria bacterium]